MQCLIVAFSSYLYIYYFFKRSGTIATGMFEELKERLEAAADAAHEEYCDAVKVLLAKYHTYLRWLLVFSFFRRRLVCAHNKGFEPAAVVVGLLALFSRLPTG